MTKQELRLELHKIFPQFEPISLPFQKVEKLFENYHSVNNLDKADVGGSIFSIKELQALHTGLIAAKPHLNERTHRYKIILTLIKKLSDMIAVYYRQLLYLENTHN